MAHAEGVSKTNVEESMQWALDLVCGYTGWPLGHIFTLQPGSDVLIGSNVWHNADPARYDTFVEATNGLAMHRGAGLPGRILASGEPAWIMDVRNDSNFPRAAQAVECGIGAGFGFPIASSLGVEGVMEFFAPHAVEPDAQVLQLLSHIGVNLGAALDRSRAQLVLEASEMRLRNLIDLAPDPLIVVDHAGTILLVNDETERLAGYDRRHLVGQSVDVLVPERLRRRAHASP